MSPFKITHNFLYFSKYFWIAFYYSSYTKVFALHPEMKKKIDIKLLFCLIFFFLIFKLGRVFTVHAVETCFSLLFLFLVIVAKRSQSSWATAFPSSHFICLTFYFGNLSSISFAKRTCMFFIWPAKKKEKSNYLMRMLYFNWAVKNCDVMPP